MKEAIVKKLKLVLSLSLILLNIHANEPEIKPVKNLDTDPNEKIELIKKEFYSLKKQKLKESHYSQRPDSTGWKKGIFEDASLSAVIYRDKNNDIRKYRSSADSGFAYTEQEEYFWPDGNVFFVFYVQEVGGAIENCYKVEVRLYIWEGEVIKNLSRKISYNEKGEQLIEKFYYPDSDVYYYNNISKIISEFKLKK